MGAAASAPIKAQAKPPTGRILKEGILLYCETQGEEWKSCQFDLYEDGTFDWSFNGRFPEHVGSVKLKAVADQISVGKDCEEVPDCPEPPLGLTINYMMSYPHNYPKGTRPTDMKNNWIVFKDDREMKEWITALEDALHVKPLGVQSKPKKAPPQPRVPIASQLAPLEIQTEDPDSQADVQNDQKKTALNQNETKELQHTDFRLLLAGGQAMSRYSEDNMPHFGQA
ncbi:uncharacterized protein LOC133198591 [Saccostrea echinata]|uniref:uncharacterized protein LOC133198591 n=1 Tax=Saccostrea echinata TaxID=191078 RepID=UPI002A838DD2|nr:uncharacterized protein LOC133198591 [Saccostrea echinata]